MNRILKRFLFKMIEPAGFILYGLLTFAIAGYMQEEYGKEGFFAVLGVMFFLPIMAAMLRLTWLQAKIEVERENQEMMQRIKGE